MALLIERGLGYAIFAYDAARSINLAETERRLQQATHREPLQHRRRAPRHFEVQPAPLRVSLEAESLVIGEFQTRNTIDLMLYEFGAVSVIYAIAIDGPFSNLLSLGEGLYDNQSLLSDSRGRVERLLEVVGDAAGSTGIRHMVEDYVIFHVQAFAHTQALAGSREAESLWAEHRDLIAQILRAEPRPLSAQEVEDAVSARISYGVSDLTIVDWNAALVVDAEGDDVRAVLEFANVELLELRYLDQKLDRALDESYETLLKRPASRLRRLGYYGSELRRVAEMQVDNATLFEGVNNSLKLIGDQYLARAYRLASRRFHLDEWDAGILRKLETLESIYEKISDQASNRRMEVLEWVIIVLIAFSIVLELLHLGYA